MTTSRTFTRASATRFAGAIVLLATLGGACPGVAHAQGRLDATYVVTLSGVPIGNGSWTIDVQEDQYSMGASGGTTGLLRIFASGQGNSTARGTVSGGQLISSTYASTIVADKRSDEVRVWFSGGNLKEYIADPPTMPSPDRVPLTEAHRKGVVDPMTAFLIRVPGTGDTFVPEACERTLPVFDGRMRYDLRLAFKRLEKVKADKGYQGTVAVCSVYFSALVPCQRSGSEVRVIKYPLVGAARHGNMARAPCGYPADGALPGVDPDADRARGIAGDPVCLGPTAGAVDRDDSQDAMILQEESPIKTRRNSRAPSRSGARSRCRSVISGRNAGI